MGKGRGRPGGNPGLKSHQFSNDGKPLKNKIISIRFTEEEMDQIKAKHGDRITEICRQALLGGAN